MGKALSFRLQQQARGDPQQGTSLAELVIVVAVAVIATAMAIPTFTSAISTYKLRTATVDTSSLIQRARMRAVRDNRWESLQSGTVSYGSQTYTRIFLDLSPGNGTYDQGEPVVQLPLNITRSTDGSSPGGLAPGFVPQPLPVAASFNGRGMPCVVRAGVCSNWDAGGTEVGFVYYLRHTRRAGVGWSAISISPSGQVKTWMYSGGQWNNY